MTIKDNIILLGAPRSGTSLLTSLLHNPPSFVCLSEPLQIDVLTKRCLTPTEFVENFVAFISEIREDIQCGRAIKNRIDPNTGALAENYIARHKHNVNGWVTQSAFEWRRQTLPIPRSRFHLLVKRNAPLIAVIEHLVKREDLTVIGMLRDPVSTILSWRSLDLPISRGHLHSAERISWKLRNLVQEPDLLLRQVRLLNWIFERIMTYLPPHAIICYEDFVDAPRHTIEATGLTLSRRVSQLESRNSNAYYNYSEAEDIWNTIARHAPNILAFQNGRYIRGTDTQPGKLK